jgi:3-methyladenine DNA glycosylase AlkD
VERTAPVTKGRRGPHAASDSSQDWTGAVDEVADEILARIRTLAEPSTQSIRRVRREYSVEIRNWPGPAVLDLASRLAGTQRWVAYELVHHHRGARSMLDAAAVKQLGRGLDSWGAVDAFARYISGPAWQQGRLPDALIQGWAASDDRWWRRAALVSTVPLNLRAAGGTGDTRRTLDICERLVDDRDDMVVKALSWALRELVIWDRAAVHQFLTDHNSRLAARARREVTNKLEVGLKDRRR